MTPTRPRPKSPAERWWLSGEWAGLIAFVLALGVAISMTVALVGSVLSSDPISSEKASLLSTLYGAAIGVIGTYIGAHGRGARRASDMQRNAEHDDDDDDD